MKFLLPLLRNNILQLSHANQLRYADTKNRTKTITLYMLIAAILMGLLAYLIYSLKIIYALHISTEYLLRGVITETDSSLLMEKISTLTPKQYRHFEDILDSFIAAIQEEA